MKIANLVVKTLADAVQYRTDHGAAILGSSDEVLKGKLGRALKGKVQLIFTSPPFPLNRKKKYGNKMGEEYKQWFRDFAAVLSPLLTDDGSVAIEMGNAWEPGLPVMSTLALESLLAFKEAGGYHLCQEFIWHNPARLPTPAQWVNVERIRVKDSFTRIWWMSKSPYPKANNRNVLKPYSGAMKTLLQTKKYNAGKRPSEHVIGPTSFLSNNGGAIPSNVLYDLDGDLDNVLIGSNTGAADLYQQFCKRHEVTPHPARMPAGLSKFFIQLCTEEGDVVLDPFAGSNTTGAAADELGRQWVAIEALREYAESSIGRFESLVQSAERPKKNDRRKITLEPA